MPHVVTQPCCVDGACIEVCPVDCIWPRLDAEGAGAHGQVFIDPTSCIDCGACASVCPVGAIREASSLSDAEAPFAALNAAYFAGRPDPGSTNKGETTRPVTPVDSGARVDTPDVHVVVVGAGPAGCYAVQTLLDRFGPSIRVTVLEKSVAPAGLARFGVAPDHRETRRMARVLEAVLFDRRVQVAFNVEVGEVGADISQSDLKEHADAVVWATGATSPRALVVPGCDLPGVENALDLARWYTGHPTGTRPSAIDASRVVVVGNGNVGLDIARMLLAGPGRLAQAEVTPKVMGALASSSVKEVVVLGRREPDCAAHSPSEVLGLTAMEDLGIAVETNTGMASGGGLLGRAVASVVRPRAGGRSLVLRYGFEPVEIRGGDRVEGVVVRGTLDRAVDEIACQAVVAAIGTDGRSQIPAAWGTTEGRAHHSEGRVLDRDGQVIPGTYVTGWLKRGATGGIGTNKRCAEETVASLVRDLETTASVDHRQHRPADLLEELRRRGVPLFGLEGWKAIDRLERAQGRASGAYRRPLTTNAVTVAVKEERG